MQKIDTLDNPFDSIESAQEYFLLLSEVIAKNRCSVALECARPVDTRDLRRLQATQMVAYKLARLEEHVSAARRLLNDLRMLRRLLLSERPPSVSDAGLEGLDSAAAQAKAAELRYKPLLAATPR
jgi:hypothetical protein